MFPPSTPLPRPPTRPWEGRERRREGDLLPKGDGHSSPPPIFLVMGTHGRSSSSSREWGGGERGVEWGSYARRRRCHRETRGGAEKIGAASEKAAKAAGERKDPSPRGRNLGGRRRRRLRLHFPKKKNPLLPPPPSLNLFSVEVRRAKRDIGMSPLRVRAEERERRTLVPINHSKSLAKEEQGFTFFPPSSPSSSASSGPSILLSLADAAAAAARAAKEGRPVKKGSIQSLHLMLSAGGEPRGERGRIEG